MDTFYVVYCIVHIFISLSVDATIVLPEAWIHKFQQNLLDMHMSMNEDPLIAASPIWLQAFVWIEIVLQVPFFIWAAYDLSKGHKRVWPACLAYGVEASTTTFACLVEIWFNESIESPALRWQLLGIYIPTMLVPLYMALDFGVRLSKDTTVKVKIE